MGHFFPLLPSATFSLSLPLRCALPLRHADAADNHLITTTCNQWYSTTFPCKLKTAIDRRLTPPSSSSSSVFFFFFFHTSGMSLSGSPATGTAESHRFPTVFSQLWRAQRFIPRSWKSRKHPTNTTTTTISSARTGGEEMSLFKRQWLCRLHRPPPPAVLWCSPAFVAAVPTLLSNSFFGRVVCDFLKRRKNKKEEEGRRRKKQQHKTEKLCHPLPLFSRVTLDEWSNMRRIRGPSCWWILSLMFLTLPKHKDCHPGEYFNATRG